MTNQRCEELEALERTMCEIDALAAIFNDDEDGDHAPSPSPSPSPSSPFVVTSREALERARNILRNADNDDGDESFAAASPSSSPEEVPTIRVEASVDAAPGRGTAVEVAGGGGKTTARIRLGVTLPPGYPSIGRARASILSAPPSFRRRRVDDLSRRLRQRIEDLEGTEVLMDLIEECRGALIEGHPPAETSDEEKEEECYGYGVGDKETGQSKIGRRWIWVHHITKPSRLKDIVSEANELRLSGYVKGRYPGVVVVEGSERACEEFVTWIKGNKSRPGGFGRNWGHHVRGEVTSAEGRAFPEGTFEEVKDGDMGKLAALCKQFGVEDEFREFILQHK